MRGITLLVLASLPVQAATITRQFSNIVAPPEGSATFTINSETGVVERSNFVNIGTPVRFAFTQLGIPPDSAIESAILEVSFESSMFGWTPRFPTSYTAIHQGQSSEPAQIFDEEAIGHTLFHLQTVGTAQVDLIEGDHFGEIFDLLSMRIPIGDSIGFTALYSFDDDVFFPEFLTSGVNAISRFDAVPSDLTASVSANLTITYFENPEPHAIWLLAPILIFSGIRRWGLLSRSRR